MTIIKDFIGIKNIEDFINQAELIKQAKYIDSDECELMGLVEDFISAHNSEDYDMAEDTLRRIISAAEGKIKHIKKLRIDDENLLHDEDEDYGL